MTRLTEKNISFVIVRTMNGMAYNYYVNAKNYDSRIYTNYDESGKTMCAEFKKEWLPKSVQKFIEKHDFEVKEKYEYVNDGQVFTAYIYR